MRGLAAGQGWQYLGAMVGFLLWIILFIVCWPLALLVLLLWPIVWLISIPLRLVGIGLEAVFELLRAILFLPVRLLGGRRYY
jgi:hypothetical protein